MDTIVSGVKPILQCTDAVTGNAFIVQVSNRTFQAVVVGSGAVSADIAIQVSNDGTHFLPLATLSVAGTDSATEGFVSNASWRYVRAECTAISAGATATVTVGV